MVDTDGTPLGEHDGAYAFTVGQRRGLRLGRPAADGRPRYVLDVSPVTRTVTVGPQEMLTVDVVEGGPPTWCGAEPGLPMRCLAQVRAHGDAVPAHASVEDGRLVVRLDVTLEGVAPGQAVVVYDGDRVVGSATVETTARSAPTT